MHRILRAIALLTGLAMLAAGGSPAAAVSYYFAVDVPSTLTGTTFAPSQVLRSTNAAYAVELNLPAGTELLAVHRRIDGVWLFTPAHPLTLGGTLYKPTDVVSFNGVVFSKVLDGIGLGVPANARIDALLQLPTKELGMSFDVPVNLGGIEYSQSDIVSFVVSFSLYWDADGAGVPTNSNVVGASVDGAGNLVVTFDVPTRIAGTEYR